MRTQYRLKTPGICRREPDQQACFLLALSSCRGEKESLKLLSGGDDGFPDGWQILWRGKHEYPPSIGKSLRGLPILLHRLLQGRPQAFNFRWRFGLCEKLLNSQSHQSERHCQRNKQNTDHLNDLNIYSKWKWRACHGTGGQNGSNGRIPQDRTTQD